MSAELYELGANENMSVEEALTLCLREAQHGDIDDVLIICSSDDGTRIRSSRISRANANWLIDQAKLHTLTRDLQGG